MRNVVVTLGGREYAVTHHGADDWTVDGLRGSVQVTEVEPGVLSVLLDGRVHRIVVRRTGPEYVVLVEGVQRTAVVETERDRLLKQYARTVTAAHRHRDIRAPMPALVGRILVTAGQEVQAGEPLLVLEAMKMENEIRLDQSGRVHGILVERGQTVEKGQILISLE